MRRHVITTLLSSLALSLTACGGGGSKEAPALFGDYTVQDGAWIPNWRKV